MPGGFKTGLLAALWVSSWSQIIIMPIAYYQMLAEEIRHSLVTFKILSQYRPPFL